MAATQGLRVIRGPGWTQGEADGGYGHVGTVIAATADGSADVIWDNGQHMTVKPGSGELRVLDNAPVGVRHLGVACVECGEVNIVGMRWLCEQCADHNLCSLCYFNDSHDIAHPFWRYETPDTPKVKMEKRSRSMNIHVLGIFPDATVVRGRDWEWGDQDGGAGKEGVVTDMMTPSDNSARSMVKVVWQSGGSNVYRLGHKGKVDLRYTEQAPGAGCYPDHLPVFDAETYKQMTVAVYAAGATQDDVIHDGDRVYLDLSAEKVLQLRQARSEIVQVLDRVGQVQGTLTSGEAVVAFGPRKYRISQSVLRKVPKFRVGDHVRVLGDERKVAAFQDGHGGYNRNMRPALGKVGEVTKIDKDGDLEVQFQDRKWCFNPVCLVPAPGKSVESVTGGDGRSDTASDDDSDAGESGMNLLGELMGAIVLATAAAKAREGMGIIVFLKAIIDNDVDTVQHILLREPRMVGASEKGTGALIIAANLGHATITELLVNKGADVNQRDKNGNTPLMAGMKHDAIAEFLIKKGADVKAANGNGQTASHLAAAFGHGHILRQLLARGADFNAVDKAGDTPLHDAIREGRGQAAEVLIGCSRTDLRRKNKEGFPPLHLAAFKGDAVIADMLVKKNQSLVNEQKDNGASSLHVAAVNNHTDVMKVLLDKGKATVDLRTQKGKQTALHLAAQEAYMDAVQLLTTHGADVNAKDSEGNRPLHILLASHTGPLQGEQLMLLLLVGQAPRVKGEERVRIACYLLQAGADPEARNDRGKTAVECCPNTSIAEAVQRFLAANPGLARQQRPTSAVQARERAASANQLCRKCCRQQATILLVPCGHRALCAKCCSNVRACPQCSSFVRSMHDENGREVKDKCCVM